jgi:hypothetical protein
MTDVPKIVVDRLRTSLSDGVLPDGARPGVDWPEGAHPDSDLLTAFAEQMLAATERDGVLEHLTRCGDCREVIALALPAADIAGVSNNAEIEAGRTRPVLAKAGRNWLASADFGWLRFSWPKLAGPGLRWAALAAGVVLAGSLLLMHPGKLNQALAPSSNQGTNTTPQSPGAQAAALSSPIAPAPVGTSHVGASRVGQSASGRSTNGATSKPTPKPPAEETLMARNDAPVIRKAKPALPDAVAGELQKAGAAKPASDVGQILAQHDVTWTIAEGVLQRSLDGGRSWQNALQAGGPVLLLCYASRDHEVWTGGQAGTLFHSADDGVTWVRVQPSINGHPLGSDITHIDLVGGIVVSSGNNETWSSADGGQTWEKK